MKNRWILSTIIIALFLSILNPITVNAKDIGTKISANITCKEELVSESTVYFGEIFVNGVSQMQYIYSSNVTRAPIIFDNIKNVAIEPFKSLVPKLITEETDVGVKEYNYSIEPEINIDAVIDWTNANSVANTLYPNLGTIENETNKNMYDHSTTIATAIDNQKAEREDTYDIIVPSVKEVVSALTTTTDFVWVNNVEGYLEKVYTITAKVEKTTLNYTSVNIISDMPLYLKGDLDGNNVVDANDASVVLELYKAQNATAEDIAIGDMDNNNLIDANDASLILEYFKTHQ